MNVSFGTPLDILLDYVQGDRNTLIFMPNTLTRFVDIDVKSAAECDNVPWRNTIQDDL
jgi:hypothetical protein